MGAYQFTDRGQEPGGVLMVMIMAVVMVMIVVIVDRNIRLVRWILIYQGNYPSFKWSL